MLIALTYLCWRFSTNCLPHYRCKLIGHNELTLWLNANNKKILYVPTDFTHFKWLYSHVKSSVSHICIRASIGENHSEFVVATVTHIYSREVSYLRIKPSCLYQFEIGRHNGIILSSGCFAFLVIKWIYRAGLMSENRLF